MKDILFITILFQVISFQIYNQVYGFGSARKVENVFYHNNCSADVALHFAVDSELLKNEVEKSLIVNKWKNVSNIYLSGDQTPIFFHFYDISKDLSHGKCDVAAVFRMKALIHGEWKDLFKPKQYPYDCRSSEELLKVVHTMVNEIPLCDTIYGSIKDHWEMQEIHEKTTSDTDNAEELRL